MGGDKLNADHWVEFYAELGVQEFSDVEIDGDDDFE